MSYQNFIFKDYQFDEQTKLLHLYYSYDGMLEFNEQFKFDFEFSSYDNLELDKAIQALFFMAGVSYYKAYLAPNIVIEKGSLDKSEAEFFSKTYQRGLGEFFYVNKLDPTLAINFPVSDGQRSEIEPNRKEGLLVGLGGGKDSLVSVELLRQNGHDVTTWSLSHRSQLEPLVREIGLNHLWVDRTWDRSLLEHNAADAFNGHVPISAILACVGTIVAVLSGNRDVIVSNESSANDPDLVYQGVEVNHQYSKSLEFEKDYQKYLKGSGASTRYYSYLRPFSEVYIAEIFANTGFSKYKGVFSSCNRAFTHDSDHMFWCGKCPKCAFTYLALSPFVDSDELTAIWSKNLLLEPSLEHTYEQLLGINGDKPLDCVGEVKESRAAMRIAQKMHPELSKYKFDIPNDYDYKTLASHSMPDDLYKELLASIPK